MCCTLSLSLSRSQPPQFLTLTLSHSYSHSLHTTTVQRNVQAALGSGHENSYGVALVPEAMTDKNHVPDSTAKPMSSALSKKTKKTGKEERKVKFGDVAIRQYFVEHSDDESETGGDDKAKDLSLSSLSLEPGKDVDGIKKIIARKTSLDPESGSGIEGLGSGPGSALGPPLTPAKGDTDDENEEDETYEKELKKEVVALRQELEIKRSRSNSSGSNHSQTAATAAATVVPVPVLVPAPAPVVEDEEPEYDGDEDED